jgi:hypothetical protein
MVSTIGVRFTDGDRGLIDRVCEARGENLSSFVRRAVRKELASFDFYSDDVKKALGLAHAHAQEKVEED